MQTQTLKISQRNAAIRVAKQLQKARREKKLPKTAIAVQRLEEKGRDFWVFTFQPVVVEMRPPSSKEKMKRKLQLPFIR